MNKIFPSAEAATDPSEPVLQLAAVIEHLEVAHAIATDPFVAAVTAISPCDTAW